MRKFARILIHFQLLILLAAIGSGCSDEESGYRIAREFPTVSTSYESLEDLEGTNGIVLNSQERAEAFFSRVDRKNQEGFDCSKVDYRQFSLICVRHTTTPKEVSSVEQTGENEVTVYLQRSSIEDTMPRGYYMIEPIVIVPKLADDTMVKVVEL